MGLNVRTCVDVWPLCWCGRGKTQSAFIVKHCVKSMRGGVGGAGKSSTTVHTASPGASWKKGRRNEGERLSYDEILIGWFKPGRTEKYFFLGHDTRTLLCLVHNYLGPRAKYSPIRPSHSQLAYTIATSFPGPFSLVRGRVGGGEKALGTRLILLFLRLPQRFRMTEYTAYFL